MVGDAGRGTFRGRGVILVVAMAMATKFVQPHFFEASGKRRRQVTATPHAKEAVE